MTTDTQAQHTPGLIKYHAQGDANTYAILIDENDEWLMALLHNGHQATARQEANLRRLAACWNACIGWSTGHLEHPDNPGFMNRMHQIGTGQGMLMGQVREVLAERDQLRTQADDLIAITARQTQELAAAQALQAQLVEALKVAQKNMGQVGIQDGHVDYDFNKKAGAIVAAALTATGAA